MVQKMLPPNGRRAEALAEETGLPQPTLSRWLREADKVGVMNIPGRKWTLVEKVDSAFLFAGVLTVASYFDRDTAHEVEIRSFANALYQRADWNWARDGGAMARS
jgi:hypothetical protein